ncbi:peptide-methionine (S)-S-oxide reductase [Marinospirillum celere]|uniref:Peptide methionine sulfoxide reductase MsrA n=1 Tax=Marinospirillum celere TaxID=1122252 RepID=A0A1I1EXU8_9GAMM|nr:peptide-methionine (S)-S-oxide reductase MsrA [Marinospirillum celere]SFB91482.1 peptide-methionine (S)-S-oxide reductase [Marinospirillum celere]
MAADDFPLPEVTEPEGQVDEQGYKSLVLAGGCFWCVEAVFQAVEGVEEVVSGYAGGSAATATYEQVCSGATGHAEVVKVCYNPAVVSRGFLLKVFFSVAHDPTQLNRQGNDVGTQYRSAVFYQETAEKNQVEGYIKQLDTIKVWPHPLVTQVEFLDAFYPAEAYHQNFARQNPAQPYIQAVSQPKVEKLKKEFTSYLKP